MRGNLVNAGLTATIAITGLAYELDILAPADAFFAAAAALILYTGHQFARREGMALGEALADIFARLPARSPRRVFHVAYLASVALGLLVMAQAVIRV